jgi:O-antigen biosynthesis protein WbqV
LADIGVPGVMAAQPVRPSLATMRAWLDELAHAVDNNERAAINRILRGEAQELNKHAG